VRKLGPSGTKVTKLEEHGYMSDEQGNMLEEGGYVYVCNEFSARAAPVLC
jgi:hypothetical protein